VYPVYPAIAGYNWIQLDTAGFLDTAGYSRIQLDTAGYSRIQLDTAGYNWIQLDTAGYSWIQQDTAGYSRIQLDTAGYGGFLAVLGCPSFHILVNT
jgi:hypothetical protein